MAFVQGELSGTRAWGAPLASKIISKSIKLGLNQFAMEIVAASIAEGRTYMVSMQPLNPAMSQDVKLLFSLNYTLHMLWKVLKSSPPVWEEITTHADSDKQVCDWDIIPFLFFQDLRSDLFVFLACIGVSSIRFSSST